MDAGLYWECEAYEIKAEANRTGTGTLASNNESMYADSPTTIAIGFHVGVSIKPARVEWRVAIPALTIDSTYTVIGTPPSSSTAYIVVYNLKVHRLSTNVWRTSWTSWEFYGGGTLRLSGSAGSVTGTQSCMAGIPMVGIPAALEGTAIGAEKPDVPEGDPQPISFAPETVNAGGTARGGWRFMSGGEWIELPVALASYTVPSFSCPQSCSPPTVSVSTTYDASITVWDNMTNTTSTASWTISQGRIDLVPSNDKSIERMNLDYGALWLRTAIPQAALNIYQTCTQGYSSRTTTSDSEDVVIEGAESELLAFVTNDTHVIEDVLGNATYAGVYLWATKVQLTTGTSGTRVEYNITIEAPLMSGTCPSWQSHGVDLAEYINTWGSPHSSYSYHFQDWEADGSPVGADDYWNPARTQHIHNIALPSGEDTHQRNFIVESPLIDGGGSDWFKTSVVANSKSWFVGISRFQTVEPSVPASYTYTSASSAQWSATDCTLSFGPSITVTPDAGKTSVVVKLDAGVWTSEPYQLIHICDRIKPHWQLTNVTAVRVYGESADGSTKVLLENTAGDGYTTRDVQYAIPRKNDTKYAGSHAQDNGLGSVTDTGTDLKAAGQSATVCADSERVYSFNLLEGGTFAYIRFEIDLSGPVTLEYPIIYPSASAVTVLQENGHHSMLLWPDGPGIRFGQWDWWDGSNVATTPSVDPLGSRKVSGRHASVLDGLCWNRAVCQGTSPSSGIVTEITGYYDTIEGQTAYKTSIDTHSFILPPGDTVGSKAGVIALVNSFSEMPPHCCFPTQARDGDYEQTGGWVQETHTFCQLKRYLVSNKQTDLYNGSTKITSASATTVSGWFVSEYAPAVDNTESAYKIIDGSGEIASVRPWWGWFFNVIGASQGGSAAYKVSKSLKHPIAQIVSGELWFGWTGNYPKPLTYTLADTGIAADWVRFKWDSKGAAWFVLQESGAIVQRKWAGSLVMSTTIAATGKNPCIAVSPKGLRYIYWIDGTAIKGQVRDAQNNVVHSTFTAVASGVDDYGIDADWSPGQGGKFNIILLYTASGSLTQALSVDGAVFV